MDGRNFESLFSNPTCDPTQRLRGNPPITLNPNPKVDGRNFESLFSNPTCDPTQRLRGNPITLNLQAL
ncbi:MAG: hypothetical protein PHH67_11595, partial [Methanosarcina sp.]|nr:hypothetical protein [Methanosarcina sp.]